MTIAITGVGAVTALGATAEETWARLAKGERAFAPVTLFDAEGYRSRIVAEVRDLPLTGGPSFSRTSELALRAARGALAQADLPKGSRIGLIVGGSTAGMLETESTLATLLSAEGAVDPDVRKEALSKMLTHPLSAPADRLGAELGPFHRVRSLSSACSSGANAMLLGAIWLELGLCDAVLAGASDALCRITMSGFNALGALDPDGARPFDRRRKGLTLGEGAGFVVLEPKSARKPAICTLLGWASRSEASHVTNPEPTGEAPFRAMQAALARAGATAAEVDWVHAHGTGTPLNDPMETKAIGRALGEHVKRVPVSSHKGQIGHTLGACGAIASAMTALSIQRGVVLPTGGLQEPDPECNLVHVMSAIDKPLDLVISSSFGFGGMDTVLVLGGAGRDGPPAPSPRRVFVTGCATLTPAGLRAGAAVLGHSARDISGGRENRSLDTSASEPSAVHVEVDAERGRRLDRTSRLAAVTVEAAFGGTVPGDAGVVLGSAFGAVDATSTFLRRLAEKGPRLVPPAEFPSLVPSAPAGHVSIYLGLRGPAMVVADLSTSGEAALASAVELVAAGEVDRIASVAVEERSAIVESVLSVVFGTNGASRREGAAALALGIDAAGALAEVGRVFVWTSGAPDLPPPPTGAIVVSREPFVWGDARYVACDESAGTHEAVGGVVLAIAAAHVASGIPAALAVGLGRGAGYAVLLVSCAPRS